MSDKRQESDESRAEERDSAQEGHDEKAPEGSNDEQGSGDGEVDEEEDPKAVVQQLEEEGPPEKLEDWPQGKAKYETFGGPEGEHGYHEGPEQQLGPSSLRHHDEGGVSIAGDEVDDPDEYKGEPIPGGPTDPDSPLAQGEDEENEESGESDGSGGAEAETGGSEESGASGESDESNESDESESDSS
jgi:hypothetical protein